MGRDRDSFMCRITMKRDSLQERGWGGDGEGRVAYVPEVTKIRHHFVLVTNGQRSVSLAKYTQSMDQMAPTQR